MYEKKGNLEMFERGQVFFKDVDIDNFIRILGQELNGRTHQDYGDGILACGQSEGDPKCLDGKGRGSRVLPNDQHDGSCGGHSQILRNVVT
jgi:hypothetical protein